MDKSTSHKIVRETFENSFDKERFVYFVKNLLNSFDDAPFVYRGNFIPDAYEKHISALERIGKYSDGEFKIDILIVHLKKETSIERARSMQRNFIAWYLNGSRGNELKDAALVAFVSPDNNDWRFSLVKMDYKFEEGKDGKMKVKEEFTPARRWSFLVGANENSHTAQSRLAPIMEDDQNNPVLKQLEEAFSVEVVTKEFFKEYESLFIDLVKELDNNHIFKKVAIESDIDTENFAKKLLGQIVFLYFLQKKCWLGATKDKLLKHGDKDFLQNLFDKKYKKYNNFFNDILEHLFYDALNKKTDKSGTFYRDYFKCQIPFLNGGLFDPEYKWRDTNICLDDKIFERILEVFNRYNFTVDESSPIDQEVAIDPEMLGKVFENLLSENLRKGKGTYYTPREIVHYMCQESLINYLASGTVLVCRGGSRPAPTNNPLLPRQEDIAALIKHSETKDDSQIPKSISQNAKLLDEKLASIKICDPACGSGAFLVGMLQEIIKARQALQEFTGKQTSEYDLKKETIQNCIYGVDIDPGAIEIAKLRLWLSLVVDYELEEIEPLPNLDYKIMQGNSLLEEFEGIKFYSEKDETLFKDNEREEKTELLRNKKIKYFSESDGEKKEKLKIEISDLIDWFVGSALEEEKKRLEVFRKNEEEKSRQIVNKKDRDNYHNQWSDKFLKEGKIDELLKKIHDPKTEKPFFLWKLNFMEVFEKGGFDVVIANPPYVDSEMMKKTDEKMRIFYSSLFHSANGNWDLFVIFIEKGLGLTKNNGIISYIVPNKLIGARYSEKLRSILLEKNIIELRDYSNVNVFKEASVYPVTFVIQNNSNQETVKMTTMKSEVNTEKVNIISKKVFYQDVYWDRYFVSKEILNIILKMSRFNKLSSFCNQVSSSATVNEAYEIKKCLKEKNIKIKKDFKKLINTGTIDRYLSLWGKKKTQYIKSGYKEPIILNNDLKKINLNRYKQANSKKIIIAGMTKQLECFYDDRGKYTAGKSTTVILEHADNKFDLKFILAVLNSKLISFWYRVYFNSLTLSGGFLQVSNKTIEKIPVPSISKEQQKPFINLVDQILEKKKENPQADTGELEREIDEMVYELYGLGEEEIGIVENK